MMKKRLTVHLENVPKTKTTYINKSGEEKIKMKLFNTITFVLNSETEAEAKVMELKNQGCLIKKYYLSNTF